MAKGKILVVDDEYGVRSGIRQILELEGYDVDEAGTGADAHAFAFTTEDGELPALPLPVEATIARLQASAKFQQLDEATRATALEALRETAPKAGAFVTAEPGSKTIVLEIEDEDAAAESN